MKAKAASGSPFAAHCDKNRETWNFTASRMAAASYAKNGECELTLSYAEPLSRLTSEQRERLKNPQSRKELFCTLIDVGLLKI